MTPPRRMGPRDSAAPNALLDAVDEVMRNDGYGALSSRRVALEAGLKQQLVYYYFRTMDELLLAAFKRRTERAMAALEEDARSARPVRAIWTRLSSISGAKLAFEYMALANHHDGIREEVAQFVSRSRRMTAAAIEQAMAAKQADLGPVGPKAAAFLLSTLTIMLGREGSTGIDEAHAEMLELVEWTLSRLD
jgi:AcrR family transcriptional regulator